MPFKFNPLTGQLDLVNPKGGSVTPETFTKEASETISALQAVTAIDFDSVKVASTDTYTNSKVLGIAKTTATAGNTVEIVTYGELEDVSFNFPINEPLYLGSNGSITNVPPTVGVDNFLSVIGYGLGNGAIFVNIDEQIELC